MTPWPCSRHPRRPTYLAGLGGGAADGTTAATPRLGAGLKALMLYALQSTASSSMSAAEQGSAGDARRHGGSAGGPGRGTQTRARHCLAAAVRCLSASERARSAEQLRTSWPGPGRAGWLPGLRVAQPWLGPTAHNGPAGPPPAPLGLIAPARSERRSRLRSAAGPAGPRAVLGSSRLGRPEADQTARDAQPCLPSPLVRQDEPRHGRRGPRPLGLGRSTHLDASNYLSNLAAFNTA